MANRLRFFQNLITLLEAVKAKPNIVLAHTQSMLQTTLIATLRMV